MDARRNSHLCLWIGGQLLWDSIVLRSPLHDDLLPPQDDCSASSSGGLGVPGVFDIWTVWSDVIARIFPSLLDFNLRRSWMVLEFHFACPSLCLGIGRFRQPPVLEPGLQLTWILWTQDLKDFARQSGCDVVYSETGRNSNGEG